MKCQFCDSEQTSPCETMGDAFLCPNTTWRNAEMTPEQLAEQRRSFAYGNCKIENDDITRDMVEKADIAVNGQSG